MLLGSTLDEAYQCFPDNGLSARYYLTVRRIIAEGTGFNSFSLIIKEKYRNEEQIAVYDDFTCCEKTARRIFKLFSSEFVTIISAEDILFELLDEDGDEKRYRSD